MTEKQITLKHQVYLPTPSEAGLGNTLELRVLAKGPTVSESIMRVQGYTIWEQSLNTIPEFETGTFWLESLLVTQLP